MHYFNPIKKSDVFLILSIVLFMLVNSYAQIGYHIINPGIDEQDGWIEVNASGSAAPFQLYLFDLAESGPIAESPEGFVSGAYRFEDLAAGIYSVLVIDSDGCETRLDDIELVEELKCEIAYHVSHIQHVSELNHTAQTSSDDGAIRIDVASPDDYTVTWTGPSGFTSALLELSGLRSGIYTLTLTSIDDAACSLTEVFYINTCSQIAEINGVDQEISGMSSIEIGEAVISSPAHAICNGRIELPRSLNRPEDAYQVVWSDDAGIVIASGIHVVENLCPGQYQVEIIDGCYPVQLREFTLYDCTIDPISLTPVNDCTDPDYDAAFLLSVSGGQNTALSADWLETGNGRTYFAEDARGCRAEYEFKYAEIGDWDIKYEIVKPYNGIGDPVISVTILNADAGQAPFTITGIGGVLPVNEPYELVLEGVRSGVFPLEFINKNGCARRIFVDITDCTNYANKADLAMQLKVDYAADDAGYVFAQPLSECMGDLSIEAVLQGGLAPYDLYVSSPSDPSWAGVSLIATNDTRSVIDGLSSNRTYTVRIVDDCKETISQSIEACNICDFTYQSDGRKFNIGTSGGIQLEFSHACGIGLINDDILGRNPRIKLNKIDHLIQDWELPMTIEWPASGGVTTIDKDADGNIVLSNPSGDDDGVDINGIYRTDGEDLTTKVVRADGCSVDIPFEYAKSEMVSGAYVTGEIYNSLVADGSTEYADAYAGAIKCNVCTPFDINEYTNPQDNDCFSNPEGTPKYFKWEPASLTNPCNGGGTLTFHYYDAEEERLRTIYNVVVGPNLAVFETIDDTGALINYSSIIKDCLQAGACFFNSSSIAGIPNLDKLIVAPFCSETYDPDVCDPPCADDELCIDGICYRESSCDEVVIDAIDVSNKSLEWTYYIPESMIDTEFTMTWDNFGIADELTISGVITYNSGCVGSFTETKKFTIRESGPLIIRVDSDCSDTNGSTRYTLRFNCSPPSPTYTESTSLIRSETRSGSSIDFGAVELEAFPNPSIESFTIKTSGLINSPSLLLIYNSLGEIVDEYKISDGQPLDVLGDDPVGVYNATLFLDSGDRIVKQLIKVN